jgi:hypothetical protein
MFSAEKQTANGIASLVLGFGISFADERPHIQLIP